MAYTYLITGATSDVGAALIRHLLTEAPGEDRTIQIGRASCRERV